MERCSDDPTGHVPSYGAPPSLSQVKEARMNGRTHTANAPRREAMRIAGEKVFCDRVIEVRYPYTNEVIATVPKATVSDVRRALRIARQYKARLSRHQRYRILMRTGEIIAARQNEIARGITLESGLCLKDTQYEIGRAADVLLFAANQALVDDGQVFSCDLTHYGKSRKVYTLREPLLGVISAITPFNHPLNQVIHKVAPAVATNNRVVLKPSEKTPIAALVLADALYEAGLPPEMLSVITGDPSEIADEMLTSADVDLVTFTGGVAIGRYIAAKAVYKRQVLELGGNDPIIVMEDADIDEAATLAASGSYRNSGQRCTAIKRILVQERVADDFVELLVAKTKAINYGDPLDQSTDMGTVIDEAAAIDCEARVDDAIARGARLLAGHERRGALYAPTVIDRVMPEMDVVRTETFGPVSPVIRFHDIDEAIRIANSTAYGLSSAVCTNRLDYITRFVAELNVGTVNVREVPGYRLELTPFGGIKDSGLGYKEGVLEAMKSFCNVKTYSLPW
jgi:phosphonoacetaldehyde dehydrogenase